MAQPTKIPLKMKVNQVKIPIKMKAVEDPNYSKLFYEAKLGSEEEHQLLSKHLDGISEVGLTQISADYGKSGVIICLCEQIAYYINDCSCDDEWDPSDRLAQKCELYRENLIFNLHPVKAVSLGLSKKYNQLYDNLFELWCDYDLYNEKTTVDQVCAFIKCLPDKCQHCQSDKWMKSTYFDDTSIVCGQCQNDVASLTNLFNYST
jgi:hypothetical protein